VYGIGKNNIEEAFRILTDSKMAEGNIMTREDLITCLTSEGEDGGMKIQEIEKALTYLVGEMWEDDLIDETVSAEWKKQEAKTNFKDMFGI
jgi:Fic family protein